MFTTVLTSGISSRPTQAEFLNTVTCILNIGNCVPPAEGDPTDPGDTTPPPDETTDPDPSPDVTDDTTDPGVAISADPTLAGGTYETINITGTVLDDNLDSYSLAINGTVAQSGTDMTDTTVSINIPWSVSTPERIPSTLYAIALDATDKAGNTAHTEVVVEVDNTSPDETVGGGDIIIKGGSISPEVTADDPHGPISYNWTASENNPGVIDFDPAAAEPIFKPEVEGSYVFYLEVTDGLGNVSHDAFNFGYAKELETVPLPTTTDPTDNLVTNASSTPSIIPPSANSTVRAGRDEIVSSDDATVLGSTVSAPGQKPISTNVATITPTNSGWSIFGVLWYWWLVVIGIIFTTAIFIKKLIVSRVPEQS